MRAGVVAVLLGVLGLATGVATADGSAAHRRFANCTDAVATLGPGRSRIDLRVDCWAPRRGGALGFAVTRLDSRGYARPAGIRHFDRHPTITGPGVVRSHGRCSWGQDSFGCRSRAKEGAIRFHELIRVRPGARCTRRISIATAVTTCEPTVRRPCPASLTIAQLFDGLPRGC